MRCPFLREAQVKFCCASEFRKMIVRSQGDENNERCSSPEYVTCPAAKQHYEELPSQSHCPFLQGSLVQYCSASSVYKYVPYSDPGLTCCGSSAHKYCDLFLSLSKSGPGLSPMPEVPESNEEEIESTVWLVDGIQTTAWHYYSANHMWVDLDEDDTCHIGIDPFLARVLGSVERVTFATSSGEHSPAVVLTANGIDFQMIFPNSINISKTNSHLRSDPNRVVTDPYTFGWLFEGTRLKRNGPQATDIKQGLIHGNRTREWMQKESRRLTEFVHSKFAGIQADGQQWMADGGIIGDDLMRYLSKEEALLLYNEFFSPHH